MEALFDGTATEYVKTSGCAADSAAMRHKSTSQAASEASGPTASKQKAATGTRPQEGKRGRGAAQARQNETNPVPAQHSAAWLARASHRENPTESQQQCLAIALLTPEKLQAT